MWKALEWFTVALVAIALEDILSPWWGPVLGQVLPTAGTLIQSTMVGQTETAFTTAIRYTAAGFREPGDVLLTLISLMVLFGMVIAGMVGLNRVPRPIEPPRKRYAIGALVILAALGFGYLVYALTTELGARNNAMLMYKLYQRKMAVLAPYLSPQEAREIDAQWARMDTRADLQAMDERFRTLMTQHGVLTGNPPAATPE